MIIILIECLDEYKGHCLLDVCRQADPSRLKKVLSSEIVNFKHPYTGESPLVCYQTMIKSQSFIYQVQLLECIVYSYFAALCLFLTVPQKEANHRNSCPQGSPPQREKQGDVDTTPRRY